MATEETAPVAETGTGTGTSSRDLGLLDRLPLPVIVVDRERRILQANAAAHAACGPNRELVGLRGGEALRCLHALDDPRGCGFGPRCGECTIRRQVLDTLEHGLESLRKQHALVVDRAGMPVTLHLLVSSLVGGRREAMVVLEDISEQVGLREDYRGLFEHLTSGFALHEMIWAPDGRPIDYRFLAVNPAFESLTGLSAEVILGRRVREVLPGIEPEWIETYARVVRTGEPARFESHAAALGRWYEVRAYRPAQDRFATIFSDVTEARASEARLRAIFDSARDAIFVKDLGGRYTHLNGATASLFLRSPQEILGHTDAELLEPELAARIAAIDREVLAGASSRAKLAFAVGSEPRTLELIAVPLQDPGGAILGICGISRDITAERQLRAEHGELQEQFHQAQKLEALGALAGGVAHDLNNLLTPILGNANLLSEPCEPDEQRLYADEILQAAWRARDLVAQLLAFGRRQPLQIRRVDLGEVVEGFRPLLRRTLREDIALELTRSETPAPLLADAGQLEQVLLNLAVNAQDAMPQGGRLTIRVSELELDPVSAAEQGLSPGPHVVLEVEDTGAGMSAETRQRIFEPFYTTKAQGKGTGLGLATVWGIAKQHRGHVRVESEPGQGARFLLLFPRAEGNSRPREEAPAIERRPGGGETVLVVEDDSGVRGIVARMLRRRGYDVLVASSGAEALALLEQSGKTIQLLITDVVMPGMSGRELAEQIAARDTSPRVLFISGHLDEAIEGHGMLDPSVELLQKPFTVQDLAARVRRILEG